MEARMWKESEATIRPRRDAGPLLRKEKAGMRDVRVGTPARWRGVGGESLAGEPRSSFGRLDGRLSKNVGQQRMARNAGSGFDLDRPLRRQVIAALPTQCSRLIHTKQRTEFLQRQFVLFTVACDRRFVF